MASALFSSIQSLSTNLLQAIRGTPSTSHQQQDPASPVSDQHKSVREDLEKLSRMLARIQAVQQDAEEREIYDRSVRLWLAELRGVAYQAEDVLDELYYEVLRSIVESGDAAIEAYHRDGGTKRKFDEMYTSSSLASKVSIPDGMPEKIKGITKRLEEISNARRDLHLKEEDGTRLVVGPQIRPPTSSHVDERAIFGRKKEKKKIISILNPSIGPDIMVLPIVGMGGFGKTTLAQLVYNDSRICRSFNKRCWVSVSEDFDLVRLTKAIVESVSNDPCQFSELSKLQDVLKEKIISIGLFLVLDDVWDVKRDLWESFQVGFCGAKVVRILTTTRNTSVAKIMQTTKPFHLGSLPERNCWSLFKHFAFGTSETSENANLHEIGCGIVKKCKGSPLAIKALGGILRYEMDEEKWREILESDISETDDTGEVIPALRLSYQKLPQHVKPCFLYLSMFPKGTLFEKDMVVRLWMAQGYINGNTRSLKTLEEIGSKYFDELLGRSLVDYRPFTKYSKLFMALSHVDYGPFTKYTKYSLHDLIHDLARSISHEAYQPVLENNQQCNGLCKVYHLYLTGREKFLGSFLVPSNYRSIRTVVKECWTNNFDFAIFFEIACARALHLRYSLLPSTLGMLKHLRYLSVEDGQIETLPETLCLLYNLQTLDLNIYHLRELPENIKNLIDLRYFRLRSDKIQQLPESIFLLRNLHALSLRYCTKLQEVPRGIEQLTRLHILDLPESLIYMPSGIGKLTTLKPLSGNFNVMDHVMIRGLGELKDMNKLSGLLCITGLRNISDVEHSRNANLASKPNLRKLILNFQEDHSMLYCGDKLHLHLTVSSSKNSKNENDEKIQDAVLQSLQPHGNLRELAILNYGGRTFPSWFPNPFLCKTQRAEIYNCPRMNLGRRYVYQRDTTTEVLNLFGNNEIHLSPASVNSTIPLHEKSLTLSFTKEDFREVESLTWAPLVGVSCQCTMLNLASLAILEISKCTKVISVAGLDNLRNLKRLRISHCPELCNWNDRILPLSLRSLRLCSCDKLSSFPLLGVQNHSNILKVLVIKRCPRLAVLEGFHCLMKLETVNLLYCRNISISPATESLQFRPHFTIGDCPLMRDWCQKNNITYYQLNPIDKPQDDMEAEHESAGAITKD